MRPILFALLWLTLFAPFENARAQSPSWETVHVVEYRQDAEHAWQRFGTYDDPEAASLAVLFLMNQLYEARVRTERRLVRIHALTVRVFRGPWNHANPNWLEGATVRLRSHPGGEVLSTAVTDAKGRFTFATVEIGTYVLEVTKPGYGSASRTYVMPAYDATVNVELERVRLPRDVRRVGGGGKRSGRGSG